MERIKYYMALLTIALLYCNTMNSQVKYEIKTKKCLNEIYSEKSHSGSFCHIVENKTKQNLVIFFIEEENDTLPDVKLLKGSYIKDMETFIFL